MTSHEKFLHEEATLKYAFFAKEKGWMDQVRVILWGQPEVMVVEDADLRVRIKELLGHGIEVLACRACSDTLGVTQELETLGVQVVYVGKVISDMLKDGWYQLSF